MNEFKKIFDEIDTDHSGLLSLDEIKKAFSEKGQQFDDEQIEAIMELVDQDGNGELDFEEFMHMFYVLINVPDDMDTESDMYKATCMFLATDTDHSGTVDAKEFYTILKKFDPEIQMEDVDEIVTGMVGKGGEIDEESFKKMIIQFLKE